VSGTFDWSEGTVQGALTIASNGVLNLNGSGTLYLACALTNAGTITWTSGDLALDNCLLAAGPIVNSVSGLWNIQCDQILSYRCNQVASANGYFQNAGRVRKSTSIGITYVKDPFFFYNAGSIEADAGVLYLQAGCSGDTSANLAISLGGSAATAKYLLPTRWSWMALSP